MDIMELGAIGEFVGAGAVVITLIYLAIQVRKSNQIERAESQRAWVRDYGPAVFGPMMNPEMADLIRRGARDFEALTGTEKVMLSGWWGAHLLLTEEASVLTRQGLIEEDFGKKAEERQVAMLKQTGLNAWWQHGQRAYSDGFVQRMNTLLRDPAGPPPFYELLPWMGSDEHDRNGA